MVEERVSVQGQVSPFEERRGVMTTDTASMYQYFVNAIPTTYIDGRGNVTNTYQSGCRFVVDR